MNLLKYKKAVISLALLLPLVVCASDSTIGTLADNVRTTLSSIVNLAVASATVVGLFMTISGVVKFKAHRDNPQQVPLSAPIVLIFIGVALMFIPSLIGSIGTTVFGDSSAQKATLDGGSDALGISG